MFQFKNSISSIFFIIIIHILVRLQMHSETACWNELIGYSVIICQCHRAMIKPTRSCETSCLKSKSTWKIISSGGISCMPEMVYLVQVMDVMVSYPAIEKCNPSEPYQRWSHVHRNPWISIKIITSYFLWPLHWVILMLRMSLQL